MKRIEAILTIMTPATMNPIRTLLTALLLVSFEANATTPLADKVDWPEFMARHDLVFETLPPQFDYGAFLGNGLLGATIYHDGDGAEDSHCRLRPARGESPGVVAQTVSEEFCVGSGRQTRDVLLDSVLQARLGVAARPGARAA